MPSAIALAVQQRLLGPTNPGLAMPLMHLALQVSNQRRFTEADGFFARAAALLATAPDPLIAARLEFYLGVHAANQLKIAEATDRVRSAERRYETFVPPGLLAAARRGAGVSSRPTTSGSYDSLFMDPNSENGIVGLSSIWRFQAVLAYNDGRFDQSKQLGQQAKTLLESSGLTAPGILPRVVRVAAMSDAGTGAFADATKAFAESVRLFDQVTPNERPVAVTLFLAGRQAQAENKRDHERALSRYRRGAKILRDPPPRPAGKPGDAVHGSALRRSRAQPGASPGALRRDVRSLAAHPKRPHGAIYRQGCRPARRRRSARQRDAARAAGSRDPA